MVEEAPLAWEDSGIVDEGKKIKDWDNEALPEDEDPNDEDGGEQQVVPSEWNTY